MPETERVDGGNGARPGIVARLDKLISAAAELFSTLAAEWPAIVGEQLAPHTFVRSIRDGVCTVEADGAGYATQLRYAEHQLVERAAACCGPGIVTSFRTVVKSG